MDNNTSNNNNNSGNRGGTRGGGPNRPFNRNNQVNAAPNPDAFFEKVVQVNRVSKKKLKVEINDHYLC